MLDPEMSKKLSSIEGQAAFEEVVDAQRTPGEMPHQLWGISFRLGHSQGTFSMGCSLTKLSSEEKEPILGVQICGLGRGVCLFCVLSCHLFACLLVCDSG